MEHKSEKSKKILCNISKLKEESLGVCIRKVCKSNKEIYVLYIPEITNREMVSNSIIKPILKCNNERINIDTMFTSIIYVDEITIDNDENKIIEYVLKGKSIIIVDGDEKYIVANTLQIEKRAVDSPQVQPSLNGPRDSFTENFQTNLSLIRYRVKDANLRIDKFSIGKRTKTSVAVIYINSLANSRYVDEVKKRLNNINTDGIIQCGYIEKFISKKSSKLFPQIATVERSDTACAGLLDGKVCIMVEGSNLVLLLPQTFIEFLDSGDDHYQGTYMAVFSKFLRIFAFSISIGISALYISIVGFHSDIIPAQYILTLAFLRAEVPVNSMLEVTSMELTSEILREASIRLPKQIGPTIGIVGAIVIGQAVVVAGLVSAPTVIIVSLAAMSSFIAPDSTIMNPIHILKFMLIFITGMFGLFGFIMGVTFIVINIVSDTTFGLPYSAPVAPFNYEDMKNYVLSDVTKEKEKPEFLDIPNKKEE